jgi:Tol biopolymer transport system component
VTRVLSVALILVSLLQGAVSFSASGAGERAAAFRMVFAGAVDYRILLASNRDGGIRGYSVLPDGSRLTPLLPARGDLQPVAVSRDGSTVAYRSGDSLYASRADGSGLHRVVKGSGSWATPALSHDGRLVAFNQDNGTIAIVGSDGHELRRLTRGRASDPDWSPDGKTLVVVKGFSRNAVVLQGLDGRQRLLVGAKGAYFASPKWSPDGRWIAYNRNGLWVVAANGSQPRLVSRSVGDSGEFAWSPDSRVLAFTSANIVADFAVAGVDGGAIKQLKLGVTPAQTSPVAPVAWSPDGSTLILAGHTGDDPDQIWVVGTDGRGLRRVTRAGTNALLGSTRLAPRLSPVRARAPSERVVAAGAIATAAPIAALSADGTRVAFTTVSTRTDCVHVSVWTPSAKALVRLVPNLRAPCDEYDRGEIYNPVLAGTRVAWVEVLGCGNYCDVSVDSATLAARSPKSLIYDYGAYESVEDPPDYNLRGDGELFVFNDEDRLVRIGAGHGRCQERGDSRTRICTTLRRGQHAVPVESVSDGLIAIRERKAVAVVDVHGKLVRLFPFSENEVNAARLDGSRLAVTRRAALEVYDVATGARQLSRPLPSGKLVDVDGGIALLQIAGGTVVQRLSDGRSFALPAHTRLADIEPPGLYYASRNGKEGRLVFLPRAEVVRRLG